MNGYEYTDCPSYMEENAAFSILWKTSPSCAKSRRCRTGYPTLFARGASHI